MKRFIEEVLAMLAGMATGAPAIQGYPRRSLPFTSSRKSTSATRMLTRRNTPPRPKR